jgi:uncharacterized protein (PEP-CTERM system associated)
VSSPVIQWGWSLTYDRNYYDSGSPDANYTTEVARAILTYDVDPRLQITPRVGYERARFPLTSSEDVIYGIGGQWTPGARTTVNGFWEHRFFGSSYSAQVTHRLPRAALSASVSRGLTSYPELSLLIPEGVSVASFLDAAFSTRIPDPAERALAIEQFFARTGLPPTLATPVPVYGTSLTLQESASVSLVMLGARNALGFSVFYSKGEQISGTGAVLPPALQFGNNNTQVGGGVNFSHNFSAITNLVATASYSQTVANSADGPLGDAHSSNTSFNVAMNTRFGPRTTASAGAWYTHYDPSGGNLNTGNSDTLSVYARISYSF